MNWRFAGALSVAAARRLRPGLLPLRPAARHEHAVRARRSGGRAPGPLGARRREGRRRAHRRAGRLSDLIGAAIDAIAPARADRPRRRGGRALLWTVVLLDHRLPLPALLLRRPRLVHLRHLHRVPAAGLLAALVPDLFRRRRAGSTRPSAPSSSRPGPASSPPCSAPQPPSCWCARACSAAPRSSPSCSPRSVLPRIIIAVALFYLYARLGLIGTTLGLVLGHTILAAPYVVITVMAVLKTYDERLDHAARSLGAEPLAHAALHHPAADQGRPDRRLPVRFHHLVRRTHHRPVHHRRRHRDACRARCGTTCSCR